MWRRLGPYSIAVGGAIAISVAIALVTSRASVPGVSAIYLLLVLWLGARWGRGPAVAGSVAAFLLYDFFFVPPVGTFSVRGPSELFELVVLLAVALVTSHWPPHSAARKPHQRRWPPTHASSTNWRPRPCERPR